MRKTVRWILGILVVLHGLIHLLGAAKGFGWSDVTVLRQPIGRTLGIAWLTAAVSLVLAGLIWPAGLADGGSSVPPRRQYRKQ